MSGKRTVPPLSLLLDSVGVGRYYLL
jgi:hypothetical protein